MEKKEKPHGAVVYPFHQMSVGSVFVTDKPRNNVMTALRNYNKKYPPIECKFTTFVDGTTEVKRVMKKSIK